MCDSFKRFVLNDDGNIFDSANRFTPSPACNCEASQGRDRNELHQQIYLRRCVLRTQLSFLSEKVDFLCEPETYSLAQVVYCTIYVSKLDWTIGQVAFQDSIERELDESPDASADRMLLSPFLDEVEHLLRGLYNDCDQDLLDDLLESIQIIVCQWERARTASSRSFFEHLRKRMNAPPSLAPRLLIAQQRRAKMIIEKQHERSPRVARRPLAGHHRRPRVAQERSFSDRKRSNKRPRVY
jgi:hypothetical protein